MNKTTLIVILSGLISLSGMSIQAEPDNGTGSLYKRLGGDAAISAVVEDLVGRLANDKQLGRFYAHRGTNGVAREKQLTKDFLTANTGGLVSSRVILPPI